MSASSTDRCSASRRAGDSDSSTAARESSCRNCDASVDDMEDAAREALVHGVGRLAAHREEKLRVERGRSDRRRLDDRRRLGAELRHPGQHEVAHGVWHLVGAVREELGDIEGVPGGEAPDDVEVRAARTGELGDPVAGERPDDEPLDGRRGRDVSERDAERMIARELVVAVRDEDERRRRRELSGEEPQDIQRALVRPVRVLDHDDGVARLDELEDRGGDVVGRAPRIEDAVDPRGLGDLEERPERSRCRERVASAPEEGRPGGEIGAEAPDEGRLPDARLPAHEEEPPLSGGGARERRMERRERLFALEEDVGRGGLDDRHHRILTGFGDADKPRG